MLINQFPGKEDFCQMASQHNVIPVCAEVLADTETPVSLLKKIYKDKGPVFLLESVEGGERWGRYSFLSASAHINIKVFKNNVEIQKNGDVRQIPHKGDPLSVLREVMAQYNPAAVSGLPRFWGGMVGYLTYEMVSFFEDIPNNLPDDKPIAHFIIPDELLVFDNIRHTLTCVVISFINKNDDIEKTYKESYKRLQNLMNEMQVCLSYLEIQRDKTDLTIKTPLSDERFRQMIQKTKDYIRAGDIIQAVISQPFSCSPPPDLWTLYRAQRFVNPSPYLYFLHLENTALVGSSPEVMIRLENGVATLRPIAGTRPRGKNEQEDRSLADELLQDEKERAEHLMLVDLGRNDLGRVGETGSVQVTDLMVVERYSHVMHLVSNICCDLKTEYDAWDLLRATFPAGTLSGAPKVRAMEIIAELEDTPRGPYGGAVGYISFSGNMDMAITIRTACVENGVLTVRAGAGIVADSDPESERIETVNKARAIQKALQMVHKGLKTV
ncbi:Anthranilate synthase component I [Desulfonema limicola]|uniref:Anthranilate synthase component 1 n=1 Tax=Desulfonema limicola TaxID=45656 RepID=A0A975B6W5_9BACT|nr:anthranilate synthase component I family protein [Desulfonema limicola]QTA79911.1 Anthranilate synthase component I [Desulfonema limicola]